MDILIRETDSRYVAFEMDILWVQYPGEDPAAWLAKYPGRWELMHLKDLKKGVPTGFHNGGTDPNNDVALGTGQMDWPKILKAAQKSGERRAVGSTEGSQRQAIGGGESIAGCC